MVCGMADTRKVTVTLPVAMLDAVRRLVEAGQAPSVSGFGSTHLDPTLTLVTI